MILEMKSFFSAFLTLIKCFLSNGIDIIYPPQCQTCGRIGIEKESSSLYCNFNLNRTAGSFDALRAPKEEARPRQEKLAYTAPLSIGQCKRISILCWDCYNQIKKNEPPFCNKCGKSLPAPIEKSACICQEYRKGNFHFQRAWSATVYEGMIKKCVHLIKFKKKRALIKPLSKLLIDFSKSFLKMERFNLLICVPLDRKKRWEREFNQASLLMEALAKKFRIPSSGNNLIKIRPTPAQSGLKRKERFMNVKGVFKVQRPGEVENRTILLIDDVFTTGATASECAKTLRASGAKYIEVLTLAGGI